MAIQTDWGRRDALCDWLTANGIDPHDVPIDGDLTIVDTDAGRAIRVEVELRSEDGRVLLDEREHRAARELRTVPLLVEPPDWWEPYEKPTRTVLLAAVERVRALHPPASDWSWGMLGCSHDGQHAQLCAYCRACYPCPTICALDEEQS